MKYPSFTREQNKSCKLNDKQIKEIRRLRSKGKYFTDIAKKFGVSQAAIIYWCKTDAERKLMFKKRYLLKRQLGLIVPRTKEQRKSEYLRKRKHCLGEWRSYNAAQRRKHYRTNPNLKPMILAQNRKWKRRNRMKK